MDDRTFWSLIDRLDWRHEGDDDRVLAPVVKALASVSLAEIEAFEDSLAQKLYSLDGRAWARQIGSGWWGGEPPVSVDDFLYSRCAVVASGKEFYEAVLVDPKQMPTDVEFEALLRIAQTAWKAKTGEEPTFTTSVSYETFSNEAGWPEADPEPVVARPRESPGVRTGIQAYDHGKPAVRRVIRRLVTGELVHPLITDLLASTGRTLVMTPGAGVEPPTEPEPRHPQASPVWRARIELWTQGGGPTDRRPSGLFAVINLNRVSPFEVDGTLVSVEEGAGDVA